MSQTILVVDDEILIAFDIQSQLQDAGHWVVLAASVVEALPILKETPVNLAIVDWHLREGDSSELVSVLKERQIPFALCSGSAFEELAAKFPAVRLISKPFAPADILSAVADLSEHWKTT